MAVTIWLPIPGFPIPIPIKLSDKDIKKLRVTEAQLDATIAALTAIRDAKFPPA